MVTTLPSYNNAISYKDYNMTITLSLPSYNDAISYNGYN